MSMKDIQKSEKFIETELINQQVIPYLQRLGYHFLKSNVRISIDHYVSYVDLVVYQEKSGPLIVVEVKTFLPDEVTLLDPIIQQAFSHAVILGATVRYLLVTDGRRHYWFERSARGQSLVRLHEAPRAEENTSHLPLFPHNLVPVTDPEQFVELIQEVMNSLLRQGVVPGLRMAIEINRILIAKLQDEHAMKDGKARLFHARNKSAAQVAEDTKKLYHDALASLESVITEEGLWQLSPSALLAVVKILEPFAFSTVTTSVFSQHLWQIFSDFDRMESGTHTTPAALADLLVQLANPRQGDRIIDPACGTGRFLVQALRYIDTQQDGERSQAISTRSKDWLSSHNFVGVELNAEVAELAATNLALNGISPKHIIHADALNVDEDRSIQTPLEYYDIVLLDPPVGLLSKEEKFLSRQYDIAHSTKRVTLEMLFIEKSIKLLRSGGLLAMLMPDTLLSSPSYTDTRNWLLSQMSPKAIISLPTNAFAPVGHAGKASILLLRKGTKKEQKVLMADVKEVGYNKFGQAVPESDIPALLESCWAFFENGQIRGNESQNALQVWSLPVMELRDRSWNVVQFNPFSNDVSLSSEQDLYPSILLRQIASISSGENFNNYISSKEQDAIPVLQAGAVRDLKLDLSEVPYISLEDYQKTTRAKVQIGDVLVTTAGQYLGRAVAIDELENAAVAGNNVTIVRPLPTIPIDPLFLAAVISSDVGKRQIAQKQIFSSGRSYIRRDDLGTILIPLPPLEKQRSLANRLREMASSTQKLTQLAQQIEDAAKRLVMLELQQK